MKNIKSFNQYHKEEKLNEEILSKLFSKLKSWVSSKLNNLKGWAKQFYQNLLDGRIRIGNDGRPVMMLFDQANGSVLEQYKSSIMVNESVDEAQVPLTYSEPDKSVPDVGPEELFDLIDTLYDERLHGGPARPIFIYGAPGIGKTEIVAQAADRLGISMEVLLVQNMAPEDLVGVPSSHEVEAPEFGIDDEGKRVLKSVGKGVTRFNTPFASGLPIDNCTNGKGGIVFMDEFNKADENVIKKLNQFVQKGMLPGYKLPSKWILVAAGNRPADKVMVSAMDASMVQRFDIVNFVPEVGIDKASGEVTGGWAKYVMSTGKVLPELIYFIASEEQLFHYLDASLSEEEQGIFPTPRAWTDAALSLHRYMEKREVSSWREVKPEELQKMFHRKVGPIAAAKFVDFLNILRELSDTDMKAILQDGTRGKLVEKFRKNKRYLYVISHNLLKLVPEDMDDLEKRDTQVYNIIVYLERYEQFEILTWLLARIRDRYPEWKTAGSTDNKSVPGYEARKKGFQILAEARKKKGV